MTQTDAAGHTPSQHREGPFLNIMEASQRLGKHHSTLRRWDAKGLLKAERTPGGEYRYQEAVINDFLARYPL